MLIDDARINAITRKILGCAIEVHRVLGPGLLESIYLQCLMYELTVAGLRFVEQKTIPVSYKGALLEASYRIDLIVEEAIVVEVKCVVALLSVHEAQTLTYLRLTGCTAALLINFNVPRLMDGVRRLINNRAGLKISKKAENTVITRSNEGTKTHEEDSRSTGRPAQPAD